MAEAKKIAIFQYIIAFKLFCGVPVVVEVDGTMGSVNINAISIFIKNGLSIFVRFDIGSLEIPSKTTSQIVLERSQSSRERNGCQFGAIVKGTRFNGCYVFRDGDGLEFWAGGKSGLANVCHTVWQRD